jgi:hypothetical protein
VWGYEGSTGDVDWSWDYHRMMNTFRKYPKIAGWLYTEHHDVINEWNGYWRFDRTEKETGLGVLFPGMTLKDLHAPVYLSTGNEICQTVQGGQETEVPLFLSLMTGEDLGGKVEIHYELSTTNYIGETEKNLEGNLSVGVKPWLQKSLEPLRVNIPDVAGTAILTLIVRDAAGQVLQRNFMHFEILSDTPLPGVQVASLPASGFSRAEWSKKQWEVLDGKKVNGAGRGFFEFAIPAGAINPKGIKEAYFLIELSAKELFVKDQQSFDRDQDYMKGSRVAPSSNPNAYPMSDEKMFPSTIAISIGGKSLLTTTLPDDPADHRGVLSWHHQLQDKKLREAGSYGYLVKVPIPKKMLREAIESGLLGIRIETEGEGGIAIYGKEFGRYPVDPSVVVTF